MKYILASFALMFAMTTVADEGKPVESIRYKDGDIYTVKDNDKVFVTTKENLYIFREYPKTVQFQKLWPTERVDAPAPPPPAPVGTVPGDQAWCEDHELFANGYTFKDAQWLRSCDTNKDRVYNICDWYEPTGASVTFTEISWQDTCNDGNPFVPES